METGMHVGMGFGGLLGLLLIVAVELLVMMGMFYAVPLVMLHGAAPVDAVKASFRACFKNLLPLLVATREDYVRQHLHQCTNRALYRIALRRHRDRLRWDHAPVA